jgi:AhpD family alkylhydroperoxidase
LNSDLQGLIHCTGAEERRHYMDIKVKELIAVGAAVAGNCIPCLEWHYKKCIELGIPVNEIKEAIDMAQTVKGVPIKKINELVNNIVMLKEKK